MIDTNRVVVIAIVFIVENLRCCNYHCKYNLIFKHLKNNYLHSNVNLMLIKSKLKVANYINISIFVIVKLSKV